MAHDVVLIPGDGIGPEIVGAMRCVVEAAGVQIALREVQAGAGVIPTFGTPLPEHVLDAVREVGVAIKGPITTPVGMGFRSVNVTLRRTFDLFACVRPCLSMPGDGSRYRDVDLVIIRENTEDLYAGIAFEERIVDAACMELVMHPEDFDVLVLPNLYGDIVSDLASGLVGGLGMTPGANIGAECAIFEPTHGSAPDIAGKGIANPTAEILSGCLLLDHLGERDAAERIRAAVRAVLAEGACVTADVKRALTGSRAGAATTRAFADAVIAHLDA